LTAELYEVCSLFMVEYQYFRSGADNEEFQ